MLECPELASYTAPLFEAFLSLSACRGQGYTLPDYIRPADALAYWQTRQFCEAAHFLDVIRSLDAVWMGDRAEKAKREAPAK